jgi:hypothetical protein
MDLRRFFSENPSASHQPVTSSVSEDLSALRAPAQRRSWWNPFRAIVALSFIFLDVSLSLGG